jgi:hypothetical protein
MNHTEFNYPNGLPPGLSNINFIAASMGFASLSCTINQSSLTNLSATSKGCKRLQTQWWRDFQPVLQQPHLSQLL